MQKHLINLNSADFCRITEEILNNGQMLRFRATGRSMAPTILNGDSVTIAPTDNSLIKPGAIVLHRSPHTQHPLLHRIIKISHKNSRTTIYTRGDTFCGYAEKIEAADIMGIAIAATHNGKTRNLLSKHQLFWGRIHTTRQNLRYRLKKTAKPRL